MKKLISAQMASLVCEMDMLNDNWISIVDAASYLGVKVVTLRKWIKEKKIPAHKIGKLWKFKKSELDEWVESGKSAE